jgi:hypothetical protein
LSGSIGVIVNIRKLVILSTLKQDVELKEGIITNIISLPRSSDKSIYFKFNNDEIEFRVRVFKLFTKLKIGDKVNIATNSEKEVFLFEGNENAFYWNIYIDIIYFSSCYFFAFCFYRLLLKLQYQQVKSIYKRVEGQYMGGRIKNVYVNYVPPFLAEGPGIDFLETVNQEVV